MLEGLTLARPLPMPGSLSPLREEGEEEGLDFSALLPEAEVALDPAPADPVQGAAPADVIRPDTPIPAQTGSAAVPSALDPEAQGAGASPVPPQEAATELAMDRPPNPVAKPQITIADSRASQTAADRETPELWRMVQNLRADAGGAPQASPIVEHPHAKDAAPPPAGVPAPEMPTVTAPEIGHPGGGDPPAPPLDGMLPRQVSDQILTALRPHLATHAAQIAAPPAEGIAIQTTEPGRIEIRLDPEELGRVQITLQSEGDSLRLIITVERPDTLDLLRRHADILAQSLQQAGFTGVQLGFSSEQGRDGPEGQSPDVPEPDQQATPTPPAMTADPGGGLNLLM